MAWFPLVLFGTGFAVRVRSFSKENLNYRDSFT